MINASSGVFCSACKNCCTIFVSSLELDNRLKELTKHLPLSLSQSFYVLTPDLPYSDRTFLLGRGGEGSGNGGGRGSFS